jgi:hypothetical protein
MLGRSKRLMSSAGGEASLDSVPVLEDGGTGDPGEGLVGQGNGLGAQPTKPIDKRAKPLTNLICKAYPMGHERFIGEELPRNFGCRETRLRFDPER